MIFIKYLIRIILTAIFINVAMGAFCPFFAVSSSFAAEDRKPGKPTEEQGLLVHSNLISLDVKDANIKDVLLAIARKAKIEITLGEGIKGKINIKLVDATLEEALKELCQSNALVYEYLPDKKAYRIIRALALAGIDTPEESKTAFPAVEGAQTGQPLPPALPEKERMPPEIRTSPSEPDRELDKQTRPRYKPGELLVKFKQGATGRQIEDLHRSLGSVVVGRIDDLRLHRIKLREGLSEERAIELYTAAAIVENTEKHALRYPQMTPNDPEFLQQWGLINMKLPEAWDIARESPEVVVAVIDSGVDYRHPDLQDNIWMNSLELNGQPGVDDDGNGYTDDVRGWDFGGNISVPGKGDISYKPDPDPMDIYGHGTHVAGVIAAGVNNGLGIAGINRRARIMNLKVMADDADNFEGFAIIDALRYAKAKGAKVINCSFGGSESINEKLAFMELRDAGILAVCAAGNDGLSTDIAGNENYPADYNLDNIISVTASDRNDKLASFSNFGLASVDVMAPGVDIYSAVPEGVGTIALVRTGVTPPVEYQGLGLLYAGKTGESGITGTAYYCGFGHPGDCPAAVKGNIALIKRGDQLLFSEKAANAQAAGAAGIIIYNDKVDDFDIGGGTLGSAGNWAPAISITLAAGEALLALGAPVVTLINKPDIYSFKSGTSMATPQVTGLATLILNQCPSLGYAATKTAILATVDKIPAVAGKMVSGGRVNAFAALNSLLLPGDLSGDCRIGLDDAILAQQILLGLTPPISYLCPSCAKDANGDDQIGLPDAIFILQKIAGLR